MKNNEIYCKYIRLMVLYLLEEIVTLFNMFNLYISQIFLKRGLLEDDKYLLNFSYTLSKYIY